MKTKTSMRTRNLPDDLYQALTYRAECANRSLSQQAVVALREALGRPETGRRQAVLARIRADIQVNGVLSSLSFSPEDALRADRGR
jgi:antitoxin FitA